MWDRIRRRFGYRRHKDEAAAEAGWQERTSDRERELDRDRPEFRDDFGEHYGEQEKPDGQRF
jgi:hypothetical protein